MAARRAARTMPRSPKRSMFWLGANVFDTVLSGGVDTNTVVVEADIEDVPNPTLIRVRGNGLIRVSAIGAAGATALFTLGLIKQGTRAVSAGVGGMPVPQGTISSDWLWHIQIPLQVPTAVAENDSIPQNFRFEIDNKAMRKFDLDEALVLNAQNTVVLSTMTIEYCVAMRFLFKK